MTQCHCKASLPLCSAQSLISGNLRVGWREVIASFPVFSLTVKHFLLSQYYCGKCCLWSPLHIKPKAFLKSFSEQRTILLWFVSLSIVLPSLSSMKPCRYLLHTLTLSPFITILSLSLSLSLSLFLISLLLSPNFLSQEAKIENRQAIVLFRLWKTRNRKGILPDVSDEEMDKLSLFFPGQRLIVLEEDFYHNTLPTPGAFAVPAIVHVCFQHASTTRYTSLILLTFTLKRGFTLFPF